MTITNITKQLTDRGYEISNFYSSGLELKRSGNGHEVTTTVGDEHFEIIVRDVDAREIVICIDVRIEELSSVKFQRLLELSESFL